MDVCMRGQWQSTNESRPLAPHPSSFPAIGVEFSGRACAGINEVNFKGMAEAVSTDYSQLTFDSAFCQVEILDSKIIEVVAANPGEMDISQTIGEASPAVNRTTPKTRCMLWLVLVVISRAVVGDGGGTRGGHRGGAW